MGISSLLMLLSALPEKLQSLNWPPLYVLAYVYHVCISIRTSSQQEIGSYNLHTSYYCVTQSVFGCLRRDDLDSSVLDNAPATYTAHMGCPA